MSAAGWPLVLVESRQAVRERYGFVPVGAVWPIDRDVEEWLQVFADEVAPRYLRARAAGDPRPPMFVKLPDGTEFGIDTRAWNAAQGPHGDGWGLSGEFPRITLSPSINIVGSYHGWIQSGVITPDCEGRTFPHARGFPSA